MYCSKCGHQAKEDAVFCEKCGTKLFHPDVPPTTSAPYQVHREEDRENGGYNVLSFFFPLVGLILYLVWNNEYPKRAKGCGKWALIGFITEIALVFLIWIFVFFFVGFAINFL